MSCVHLRRLDARGLNRGGTGSFDWTVEDLFVPERRVMVHAGAPLANARISIAIREVPRLPAAMSWSTTMSQLYQRTVESDDDGKFVADDLLPGEYTVIASGYPPVTGHRSVTAGEDVTHDIVLGHSDL